MGKSRVGVDTGQNAPGPLRSHIKLPGDVQAYTDLTYRSSPRKFYDKLIDFDGPAPSYTIESPLFDTIVGGGNIISVTAASLATVEVVVPRSGVLTGVDMLAKDALATSDTNYVTATLTNKLASGSGNIAMLAATDANTTKVGTTPPGVAITAITGRGFTLNGTATALYVTAGDILVFTLTVTGTLANVVNNPRVRLTFSTISYDVVPRVVRTTTAPLVNTLANTGAGEATFQIRTTSEAQWSGFDMGDQLTIPTNNQPIFQCWAKVGAVTTSQILLIGLAAAWNNTVASIAAYSWFRCSATMGLLAETSDGTNITLADAGTGITLVADTYSLFEIDLTDIGNVRYWYNGALFATHSAPAFATLSPGLFQPLVVTGKTTGTSAAPVLTVDHCRLIHGRRLG